MLQESYTVEELETIVSTELQAIFEGVKISIANKEAIYSTATKWLREIKPKHKRGVGRLHPNELDDGLITSSWCELHERYEIADDMVVINKSVVGKEISRHQCLAGAWRKKLLLKDIKNFEDGTIKALLASDLVLSKELDNKATKILDDLETNDCYDYDTDWEYYRDSLRGAI